MPVVELMAVVSELVDAVARGATPESVAWLAEQLVIASPGSAGARSNAAGVAKSIASPGSAGARSNAAGVAKSIDQTRFRIAFAGAGRRLGQTTVTATPPMAWPAAAGVDECGRGALLLAAVAAMDEADHVGFVRDLIRRGDARERQAVLRILAALPEPARFVDIAVDACRTNVRTVFDAIACDNAFPAAQFPDPALFQMVVKALFVEAPLARVVGLADRRSPELVRMVEAFASERRAAGRTVPDDVKLVLA